MTEAWDAVDNYVDDSEERRLDVLRIRAYAIACAKQAVEARDALETAVATFERARGKAERLCVRCHRICERAELAGKFAARAMAGDVDPETRREAAHALEELFG